MASPDRAFPFLRLNARPAKPRSRGITEIRGPYYTPMGRRYLHDVLETMGQYIDGLKFGGGSFVLYPRQQFRELIDLCHAHDVYVSTGGFIEAVLPQGTEAVRRYLGECRELGFDVVEVSSGFITVPPDDLVRLVEEVQKAGLKAKPEVGIQFGAGGASSVAELEAQGTRDPALAIALAKRFLDAGAHLIMIESEGITENVSAWRTDAVARLRRGTGHRARDVRGRRPGGVRLVREELRAGSEPVRRSQPDRAVGMPAIRRLGHQRPLGPRLHVQGIVPGSKL